MALRETRRYIDMLFINKPLIGMIVNILCMAPRMVYCSVINLLWSLMSKMSTTFRPVSYGPCSLTGVTCCLRFRRDNLIVDGRQMVSMISIHGRGPLSDVYALLPLIESCNKNESRQNNLSTVTTSDLNVPLN